MKKVLLILLAVALMVSSGLAVGSATYTSIDDTTRLTSDIGGLTLGYIQVGTSSVATLAWHPDFKFGSFGLGADANYALNSAQQPSGYENLVLRYVEYDDNIKGLRYGIISGMTWGQGMLLDNYSTKLTGTVIENSAQMAWKGYYDLGDKKIQALTTKQGVYGARLEERINPVVTLGQTYISDGTVTGLGIDALMPLGFGFDSFAEYAQLQGRSGLTTGIKWAEDFMVASADFMAGYRFQDSRFVPGYFNSDYANNRVSLASAEATTGNRNGYLAKLGIKALGLATMNVKYEAYENSSAGLFADAYAKLPQEMEVTGYYQQPAFTDLRSLDMVQGAVMGGSLSYPINQNTRLITHYKKYYNASTGQVESTRYVEIGMKF